MDFEILGEIKPFELKPNGVDIRATEENKEEKIQPCRTVENDERY